MKHTAGPSGSAGWTRNYQYAADSNRLLFTSVPGSELSLTEQYLYDEHGSMRKMPHLALLEWDYADRLKHTQKTNGDVQDTYFTYDAGGQRVRKVFVTAGTIKERIYLGGYEVYKERTNTPGSTPTLERQTLHVMDDQRRIAMVETKTREGGVDVAVPVSTWRFQLDNHLGSSMVEIDHAGSVISYEEYHPYGSTAFQVVDGNAEVSAKRYRYTSKERDDETGLYYHGARYYAPWLGRWTAADPAGAIDGTNLFEYVGNNPIGFIDPDGGFKIDWKAVGKGALYAAAGVAIGVVVVAAVAATGGAAAVAIAGAVGASATTAAAVETVVVGGVYVAASAYGGYQTGKVVTEVATGENYETGQKLTDAQRSEKLGEGAVMIGALAVGARQAGQGRANARARAASDQGMSETLTKTRSDIPTPSKNTANARGKKTFSIGRDGKGNPAPVRESVPKGGPHAEEQTLSDLAGSGPRQTIMVDQVPCSTCDPMLESRLPPGSRVLVPRAVGGPKPIRSISPRYAGGIKAISEAAARGELKVEPVVIIRTPNAPVDNLKFAPMNLLESRSQRDKNEPTPRELEELRSLPEPQRYLPAGR